MATHLVTGAGSGIGQVVADLLAARGDSLVLPVRSAERAWEVATRFPGAHVPVADLGEPATLADALAGALPDRIDSVVHSAGVVELGEVGTQGTEAWRATMAVNVLAPAELTRLTLPALRATRGHVLFVNSGAGLGARPGWASYAASKHALKALADALRGEEEEHGVRVTSVYPGRTASPMQARVHAHEGKDYDPSDWISARAVADTILHALDLPRDAALTDVTLRPGGP